MIEQKHKLKSKASSMTKMLKKKMKVQGISLAITSDFVGNHIKGTHTQ